MARPSGSRFSFIDHGGVRVASGASEGKSEPKSDEKETSKETSEKAAPEREKSDSAEPADQQVDKKPPTPPKPSAEDKKAPPPPALDKGSKEPPKTAAKDDAAKTSKSTPAPAPGSRGETRVKMNRMRLRIAERLKQSQNAAASLTTFNEIDMSKLMDLRKKYKDEVLKTHDVKLGFMSAFARACSLALKEIPMANASIEVYSILFRF